MWQAMVGLNWGWGILMALSLGGLLIGLLGFVRLIVWPPQHPDRRAFEDY